MNSVHEIAQLGAAVLRETAEAVENPANSEVREVIVAMHCTLAASQGVGLAAPQIGSSRRIIIVASRPTSRYPNAPLMGPTIMINPQFTALSGEKVKDWEGCLSIPGIRALVPRFRSIRVNYLDESGQAVEQHLEDFIARVFQHEADHLDGVVYLDRVESSREIISESEYFKLLAA